MKSIRINIRALRFDGATPLSPSDRLSYNAATGNYDVVASNGSPLSKFGLLRVRDLVALDVIAPSDHLLVSSVGHSGQAGATSFEARSYHVAFGRRLATSPTREGDPSAGTGHLGAFALGHVDELTLTSNTRGEQVVTLTITLGSAAEVERLIDRAPDPGLPTAAAHATTHQQGGGDELDVTNLAGFPGGSTTFLRSDRTWASVGGGPTTVYELDWTAEASQLGITDGTVTVDGIDWTAKNTADATLFQILNGSGLQITAVSAVYRDCDNGLDFGSNAPYLYCDLQTLAIECARYDLPLTIWSYYSAYDVPTSNNSILAGVGGASSPYSAATTAALFMNFSGVGAGLKRGSTNTRTVAPDPTHNVLVWRSIMDGVVDVFAGVWSAGWPERDQLQLIGHDLSGLGATFATNVLIRRPGTALIYSVETRTSTAGAPSFTLARTRIQIG